MNFKLNTQHLKTGEELTSVEVFKIIETAQELKSDRNNSTFSTLLRGKHLAMIFDKPSLRTRFSFAVAMNELGGNVIESTSNTRKHELPQDIARVLAGYCHGIMIRTFDDAIIDQMAAASSIPIINGLSTYHHPCQILSDFFTLKERFGYLNGITLTYIGDGNNILNSLLLLSPMTGINLRYCCPKGYQPHPHLLEKAKSKAFLANTTITSYDSPADAAHLSHALYTDVWTSMGCEQEDKQRQKDFEGYQLHEGLLNYAQPNVVVMHCLPMVRGKEISETLPDSSHSIIFAQSENRLHVQKAILLGLLHQNC